MTGQAFRFALAAAIVAAATPAMAAMRAILQLDNGGHDEIVIMQAGSIDGPIMSFSCTPGKDTFGVSLHLRDHETWPVDGDKVVIKAGGETLVDQRFAADGKYLIWGGTTARENFKRVLAHDTATVAVIGRDLTFTFTDIGPQISRWRELCDMK